MTNITTTITIIVKCFINKNITETTRQHYLAYHEQQLKLSQIICLRWEIRVVLAGYLILQILVI